MHELGPDIAKIGIGMNFTQRCSAVGFMYTFLEIDSLIPEDPCRQSGFSASTAFQI